MTREMDDASPLERYTRASESASGRIIAAYSTSFGTATKLLGPAHRKHIRNIYGLVRVADEIVDGVAEEAGLPVAEQHDELTLLETETLRSVDAGFSSNPIIQAFAHTARAAQIDAELVVPFFASMRTDLEVAEPATGRLCFGERDHADYVYGSAEVIGLMCLKVFVRDMEVTGSEMNRLEHGARRLGAAFQNVNFLRDLADDNARLGRSYLSSAGTIDEEQKHQWVVTINEQLHDASEVLPLLPKDSQLAVAGALSLFRKLNERIEETPIEELYRRRVRVSGPEKALLIARAALELAAR